MNSKNSIYKEYLTTQMHEFDLIVKLETIREKAIKEEGVIYTPWHIVKYMIEVASPTTDMHIIEPSCGHGVFLIGLFYYMNEKYNLKGMDLYIWFKNKVVAVEICKNTAEELKKILALYFLKHFNLKIKPQEFTNINCHDALTFNSKTYFDLCIGNPPYIRAKNLRVEYLQFLKNNFQSCKKGTIDIYFAFIEKYLASARNLVFITPNSFLTSRAGAVLKNKIVDKLSLLIDFKEKRIFKEVRTYTCIFKASADNNTLDLIYGNDLNKTAIIKKTDLLVGKDEQEGLVDNILSGIATLCDSAYIVKKGKDNKFYATYNFISYEIESEIVVPYLKLTKIKPSKDAYDFDYMIYPYKNNKKIISEKELKDKYPMAYIYLLAVKERLLQRDKSKTDKYESWYAYGRKQGLHQIKSKYIVVIPQMIGAKCKPYKINVANLLKKFGNIVFTSGFIIPQNKANKLVCEYILGEKFIEFAKKNGKPWPGKYESYYSLTVNQIKKFKV